MSQNFTRRNIELKQQQKRVAIGSEYDPDFDMNIKILDALSRMGYNPYPNNTYGWNIDDAWTQFDTLYPDNLPDKPTYVQYVQVAVNRGLLIRGFTPADVAVYHVNTAMGNQPNLSQYVLYYNGRDFGLPATDLCSALDTPVATPILTAGVVNSAISTSACP